MNRYDGTPPLLDLWLNNSLLTSIHSDHSMSQSLVSCLHLRAAAMEVAAKLGIGSAKPFGAMVSLWPGVWERRHWRTQNQEAGEG